MEHLHYSVCPETERDGVYQSTEDAFGEKDLRAFREWQAALMPLQVSLLRREFNPDIRWLLEKI